MGEKWRPPGCGQLLQLAQQVGVESGRRTVGEKETRDRMKVLCSSQLPYSTGENYDLLEGGMKGEVKVFLSLHSSLRPQL